MELRISNPAMQGCTTQVYIDGVLQLDVMTCDLHIDAKGITTATMTRLVTALDLDVEAIDGCGKPVAAAPKQSCVRPREHARACTPATT